MQHDSFMMMISLLYGPRPVYLTDIEEENKQALALIEELKEKYSKEAANVQI